MGDSLLEAMKWKNLQNKNPQTKEAMNFLTGFVPGASDVQSGLMAAQDIKNQKYAQALLDSVGMLPMIPALGGVIKHSKESDEIKNFFDKVIGEHLNELGYPESILPNGNVKIYHGTSEKNANSIMNSGEFKGFPFFTPDKDAAAKWAKQAGKNPTVVELEVNKNALSPTGGYLSARKEGLYRKPDGTWGYFEE